MRADVLICGAGIAGSSLAILLGRTGLRVHLFERDLFPREKACGEGIMPAGVAVLERLGLAEEVGGFSFCGVRYHIGGRVAEGAFPARNGPPAEGRSIRRYVLDRILFEAAAATRGVAAHERTPVQNALSDGRRVIGVAAGGREYHAPLVVAADGVHSPLRRQLGLDAPPRRRRVGLSAHFLGAGDGLREPWVDVYVGRGYELYVTPLPEREVSVAALTEPGYIHGPPARLLGRWINEHPGLAQFLAHAKHVSAMKGVFPLMGRARRGFAPGVVLLGDAAGFVDPITGGGITQALVTSELLAGYVAREPENSGAWLPEFERGRRALLSDYERLTRGMLLLTRFPRMARFAFDILGRRPALFSHLVGVAAGIHGLGGRPLLVLSGNEPPTAAQNGGTRQADISGAWTSD